MARLGISGHRGLTGEVERIIRAGVENALGRCPSDGLVGVSCLADGADAIFVAAVLDRGGSLEAVIPAEEYRAGLPSDYRLDYDRFLAEAAVTHRLPFRESNSAAHMAASERMLDLVDELFAVWDGEPSRGFGGTADVVEAAHERGLPVTVIWPSGASRP